jgi:hypothetical protein
VAVSLAFATALPLTHGLQCCTVWRATPGTAALAVVLAPSAARSTIGIIY